MATGAITEWDDSFGQGLVTEDGNGVHVVNRQDCNAGLQAKLSGRTIPPGSQRVTFDLAVGNKAINVDLASDSLAGNDFTSPIGLAGDDPTRPRR
jgi:hypothetical protein